MTKPTAIDLDAKSLILDEDTLYEVLGPNENGNLNVRLVARRVGGVFTVPSDAGDESQLSGQADIDLTTNGFYTL